MAALLVLVAEQATDAQLDVFERLSVHGLAGRCGQDDDVSFVAVPVDDQR